MAVIALYLQRGVHASRPAATTVAAGTLYHSTDTGIVWRSDQTTWHQFATEGMVSPMTTNGDLITRSGGVPARIAIGSSGQVLTVSAGAPVWSSPAAATAGPAELLYLNRTCV